MALTKIESEIVEINNSSENIFNYLSDFKNFEKLMPSQVTEWTATSEECSFNIKGMATIGMKIIEKIHFTKIIISSNGKVPFAFQLFIFITKKDENNSLGQLIFESDLNPMLKLMVVKPLGNFFNILAHKMKDIK